MVRVGGVGCVRCLAVTVLVHVAAATIVFLWCDCGCCCCCCCWWWWWWWSTFSVASCFVGVSRCLLPVAVACRCSILFFFYILCLFFCRWWSCRCAMFVSCLLCCCRLCCWFSLICVCAALLALEIVVDRHSERHRIECHQTDDGFILDKGTIHATGTICPFKIPFFQLEDVYRLSPQTGVLCDIHFTARDPVPGKLRDMSMALIVGGLEKTRGTGSLQSPSQTEGTTGPDNGTYITVSPILSNQLLRRYLDPYIYIVVYFFHTPRSG